MLPFIMGSPTIKGTDNSLYGEDPAQSPYSTGFPVEYTYIPQEIRWNTEIKSISKGTQEHSTFVHDGKLYKTKDQPKTKQIKDKPKPPKKGHRDCLNIAALCRKWPYFTVPSTPKTPTLPRHCSIECLLAQSLSTTLPFPHR